MSQNKDFEIGNDVLIDMGTWNGKPFIVYGKILDYHEDLGYKINYTPDQPKNFTYFKSSDKLTRRIKLSSEEDPFGEESL